MNEFQYLPKGNFFGRLYENDFIDFGFWDYESNQFGCPKSNATDQAFSELPKDVFESSTVKPSFSVKSVEDENGISEAKKKTAYQFDAKK